MLSKETVKLHWNKFTIFVSNLSKVAVVIAAMFVGFSLGEIYHNYKMSVKSQKMQQTRSTASTSVAVNERKELMIFDRKTGTYQVFSDSVGRMVFDIYAARMYFTVSKSEKP
jgi:hypothetical protein